MERINQSSSSSPRNFAYSPYGISFEDENLYRKQQQQKYKEDLDYLCSLRQKRNNNFNQIQEEQRKIQIMNDVKNNYFIIIEI